MLHLSPSSHIIQWKEFYFFSSSSGLSGKPKFSPAASETFLMNGLFMPKSRTLLHLAQTSSWIGALSGASAIFSKFLTSTKIVCVATEVFPQRGQAHSLTSSLLMSVSSGLFITFRLFVRDDDYPVFRNLSDVDINNIILSDSTALYLRLELFAGVLVVDNTIKG